MQGSRFNYINPRLKTKEFVDSTENYLEKYAEDGLRTLLLAEKTISEEEYEAWEEKYTEATLEITNRE